MGKGDNAWKLVCISVISFTAFIHFTQPTIVTVHDHGITRSLSNENLVGSRSVLEKDIEQPKPVAQKVRGDVHLTEGTDYVANYDIYNLEPPTEYNHSLPTQFRYARINPKKNVLLSHRPRIMFYPEFLSEDECEFLIDTAKGKLKRSEVVSEQRVQAVRTSTQTWLAPEEYPIVMNIYSRLKDITGIKETELLQILHYDVGQKYNAHTDFFRPDQGERDSNRAATAYMYLSDVEDGGETWFPRANGNEHPHDLIACDKGLLVKPSKGALVLFYDLKPSGESDPDSLHAACPVKEGVKWGATFWLHTKGLL
jgi:prolyl 4-hydroxylase